jgi:hypothetical protein
VVLVVCVDTAESGHILGALIAGPDPASIANRLRSTESVVSLPPTDSGPTVTLSGMTRCISAAAVPPDIAGAAVPSQARSAREDRPV